MELVSAKLYDYRRFLGEHTVNLAGPVVALVGPNEAGKSSILEALQAFGSDIFPDDCHAEGANSGCAYVEAFFVLDDSDRNAISDIPGGSDIQYWSVKRSASYRDEFTPKPSPPAPCRKMRKEALTKLIDVIDANDLEDTGEATDPGSHAMRAWEALSSKSRDLNQKELNTIRACGISLLSTSEVVGELLMEYDEPDPESEINRRLSDRMPQFITFDQSDRTLKYEYDLSPESLTYCPLALQDLANTAKLNLQNLAISIAEGSHGAVEAKIDQANANLRSLFTELWSQSDVYPHISNEGPTLRLHIAQTTGAGAYDRPERRSVGLIWFVSLVSFLANKVEASSKIVLLIDEAELHLHYDAQVDLVRHMNSQQVASKAVYSTHSAACLPNDLGSGVRPVVPSLTDGTSRILKSLWSDNEAGFSTLALRMGAQALAFLPAKFVLFVEGPSDALLLPLLLRNVQEGSQLQYQICPGIATTDPGSYSRMSHEGGAVMFLVDGDDDGHDYTEQLAAQSNISEHHIFSLPSGCVLEDLVSPEVYACAINRLNRRFAESDANKREFTADDFKGKAARPTIVSNFNISLSKVDVAQEILAISIETAGRAIVDPDQRESLSALRTRIDSAFSELQQPVHRSDGVVEAGGDGVGVVFVDHAGVDVAEEGGDVVGRDAFGEQE